jgi:hypothetical protein
MICDLNATLLKTLTITEDEGVTEISRFHVLENGEVSICSFVFHSHRFGQMLTHTILTCFMWLTMN